jgi:hypothetical protein
LTGLSALLSDSFRGKWNNKYECFAHIMTNASSTEILKYCSNNNNEIMLCIEYKDYKKTFLCYEKIKERIKNTKILRKIIVTVPKSIYYTILFSKSYCSCAHCA